MKLFTRTDAQTTKKTLAIYRREIVREKKSFLVGIILIPISQFCYSVAVPLFISFIIQYLVEGNTSSSIAWLFIAILAASIISTVTNQIGFKMFFEHEERVVTNLFNTAMAALMNHSQQFFSNQKVGSLANDVNTFSRSYLLLMETISLQFVGIAVSYLASLVVIAVIAPILLVPLFLLTAFVIWHSLYSMSARAAYRNKRKELESKLIGLISDILANQTLVRLFGKKNQEMKRVAAERAEIVDVAMKEISLLQKNGSTRQIVLLSFQVIIIAMIVWLFQNQLVSIGAAIFTITYLSRVVSTMFNITSIVRSVEQALLDASKITELLDKNPDVIDVESAKPLEIKDGSISFRSVDFRYDDAKHQDVFSGLDLEIKAGSSIGLVGKSGSGKTTLTNLILRYADLNSGSIFIDDQNISKVQQDSLRNTISYVPQDPYLFHRTLRDNISYGKNSSTDEQIISAAKKAHALEFISKLPDGLDTVVGERGVKLSGGQRQRIAIARAILKDAPILILDEATSALDSESERLIQESLAELMKNRTSIVIAHRLSTLRNMDRIIVLENGIIIEDGSHEELISKNGAYASLWNHQSGGFIQE